MSDRSIDIAAIRCRGGDGRMGWVRMVIAGDVEWDEPAPPPGRPDPPADSPAGRVAWAEARLRELAAAIECGRPATAPEVRAAANQLRAALEELP